MRVPKTSCEPKGGISPQFESSGSNAARVHSPTTLPAPGRASEICHSTPMADWAHRTEQPNRQDAGFIFRSQPIRFDHFALHTELAARCGHTGPNDRRILLHVIEATDLRRSQPAPIRPVAITPNSTAPEIHFFHQVARRVRDCIAARPDSLPSYRGESDLLSSVVPR